jgi:DNA-binding GntR family transcriptional regulator
MLLGLALEPHASKELIELRQLLDIGASDLLIDKADDSAFDKLEEINNEILNKTATATLDELFEMDLNFHRTFHELANNRMMVYIYQTIYKIFAPSIKESVSSNPSSIYSNHARMIEALRSRDKSKVRIAVMETLTNWRIVMENSDQETMK